jgi:hypothetical protein
LRHLFDKGAFLIAEQAKNLQRIPKETTCLIGPKSLRHSRVQRNPRILGTLGAPRFGTPCSSVELRWPQRLDLSSAGNDKQQAIPLKGGWIHWIF